MRSHRISSRPVEDRCVKFCAPAPIGPRAVAVNFQNRRGKMIAHDNQAGGDDFIVRFPLGLAEVERSVVREDVRKDEWLVRVVTDTVEIHVRCAQF